MHPSRQKVKQAIQAHCREAGLDWDDFCELWAAKVNEDPAVFDPFFEIPFESISESSKDDRVELLIDVFTL